MNSDDETLATTAPMLESEAEPELATFDHVDGARFELGEELGRGGMGRVIAAVDVSLRRPVAIKQVLSSSVDVVRRFEREVHITAQLEHPSIVPVHAAGRDAAGQPYYVMRRIEGQPLADRLAGSPADRLALVPNILAITDAAAFAHARGIIHRDIKPANILLGPYGATLLIDWGLARELREADSTTPSQAGRDDALTRAGDIYGTPAYMAPEQARGEPVDERADVFAIGATLFHLLAGRAPYDGVALAERIAGSPPPVVPLPSEIPAELATIVAKSMADVPARRYRNAGELADDLRAFLAGQLVAAHRYTRRERLVRFVRRHRLVLAITVLALAVLVAGGVFSLTRILRERDRADAAAQEAASRAELMTIERASTLARTEPAHAVALLRDTEVSAANAPRARDIIAIASAHGIARYRYDHTKQVNALAISPDERWLASCGQDGRIVLHDLVAATSRVLVEDRESIHSIVWTDGGRTLTAITETRAIVVDPTTSAVRGIATGKHFEAMWAGATPDRVRITDRILDADDGARVVVEVTTSGESRTLAREVTAADSDGDLLVFVRGDRLFVLDGDREREVSLERVDVSRVAVYASRARGRIYVSSREELIEWSVTEQRETDRWQLSFLTMLHHGPRGTYAVTGQGRFVTLLSNGRTAEHIRGDFGAFAWGRSTAHGSVIAFENGYFVVVDAAGMHRIKLEQVGTRWLAVAPRSMIAATGTADGQIRWLDLSRLASPPLVVPKGSTPCAVDRATAYTSNMSELYAVERATGASRVLFDSERAAVTCAGFAGSRLLLLVVAGPQGVGGFIVDRRTGASRTLPEAPVVADDRAGAIVVVRGSVVVDVFDDDRESVVWTAPQPIIALASSDPWVVVQLADGSYARIDRKTGAVTFERSPRPGAHPPTVSPSGHSWFVVANELYHWSGDAPATRVTGVGNVSFALALPDSVAVATRDNALWRVTTDGRAELRAPPAKRITAFGPDGVVASYEGAGRLAVRYFGSGEGYVLAADVTFKPIVLRGGHDFAAAASSGGLLRYFEDPVPATFADARKWIDTVTNARIDPATRRLVWQ